jgi:hypothetical protein
MSDVSNGEIYGVLLALNEKVGSLTAKMDSHHLWMGQHVEDDRKMGFDIHAIQLAQPKSKGTIRTWGLIATGAATVASIVASVVKFHL